MKDTAQPAFFVAAQGKRNAPVRATFIKEADIAVGIAEGYEILAEQPDPFGRAVRDQFGRAQGGSPVLAEHIAHGGARSDPA